jgi:hypothetical protein
VRRILSCTVAGLIPALWLWSAGAGELKGTASGKGLSAKAAAIKTPAKPSDPATCSGDYGTSVHFEKTPSDAAKKALKEEKLVCVLHISGLFEDPDFT